MRQVTCCFFFQAEDGIRDYKVTGVQTCALPIYPGAVAVPGAGLPDGAGVRAFGEEVLGGSVPPRAALWGFTNAQACWLVFSASARSAATATAPARRP